VEARQKKLLKRMVASPMPKWQYLAYFCCRGCDADYRVVVFLAFYALAFGVRFAGH